MFRYFIASLGILLVGSVISPAAAQQMMCGDRGKVVASLEKGYSEAPSSMGLASNGAVIEIFTSAKGTFTIVMTQPSGLSCLMAAGESWEDLPKRDVGAKIGAKT